MSSNSGSSSSNSSSICSAAVAMKNNSCCCCTSSPTRWMELCGDGTRLERVCGWTMHAWPPSTAVLATAAGHCCIGHCNVRLLAWPLLAYESSLQPLTAHVAHVLFIIPSHVTSTHCTSDTMHAHTNYLQMSAHSPPTARISHVPFDISSHAASTHLTAHI
jgi:hypothetical protein